MGIDRAWPWLVVVASCVPPANNPPPPQQWQQAPPAPGYEQPQTWQQPPAQQPQTWQQPPAQTTPAPAQTAQYTPCQYACGQISRCNLQPYDGCVTECRATGAEQQDTGRQVLDSIARMTCEQISAQLQQPAQAPPPATTPPATSPPPSTPPSSGGAASGRWVSAPSASYTNAAMVSSDIYLDITINGSSFRGSWARYVCFAGAYGILSCSKGSIEGNASGQLDANGSGWIDLANLGRSSLTWTSSGNEVSMELPRNWQGENVLFRAKVKR